MIRTPVDELGLAFVDSHEGRQQPYTVWVKGLSGRMEVVLFTDNPHTAVAVAQREALRAKFRLANA